MSKKKNKKSVGYVVGSLALGAVASVVVPKLMNYGTAKIYKKHYGSNKK